MPKMRNASGTLTAYAFACGYVESFTHDGSEYYGTDGPGVALYQEGCWHVKSRLPGVTHGPDGYPLWVGAEDGGRTRADWQTFDTLTEARKHYRRVASAIRRLTY